jgi:Ran GTPase-activating protein (RanGAP) involved in mRNA processing and transport
MDDNIEGRTIMQMFNRYSKMKVFFVLALFVVIYLHHHIIVCAYEQPIESQTTQGSNPGCNYDVIFTSHKIKMTNDGLDMTPSLSCTIISLTNNKIDDNMAILLSKKLKYISGLEALYLHYNEITNVGIIAISLAMQQLHMNLFNINVRNNKIGDDGAIELARTLNKMSRLTYLNIGNNKIGNAGLIAISNALRDKKAIAELHVDNNLVNDTAVVKLVKDLNYIRRPKLRKLILHTTANSEATCLEVAIFVGQGGKQLEYLDISGVNISTKCAAVLSLSLKQNIAISHLFMNNCALSMESINIFTKSNFKTFSQLVFLDISENFLSDEKGLLNFAKNMMKYTKARVNAQSFSLKNVFKILFPSYFGNDALIASYLYRCTEDPDRDNSMCDDLDNMIETLDDAEEL